MRFFRRKSDAELLDAIIKRQDPRSRPQAAKAPPRTRTQRNRPGARLLTPFVSVLIVCAVAAVYFVDRDWPTVVETYRHATGQAQITPPGDTITGRASVLDADTIEIHGQRFRFDASDALESDQTCVTDGKVWPCGRRASFALADLIGERPVTCEPTGKRSWERLIARCYQAGVDLGAWTVEHGWALAYRRFSLDYVPHEDRARAAQRGMWSGTFQVPWEWRKAQAAPN